MQVKLKKYLPKNLNILLIISLILLFFTSFLISGFFGSAEISISDVINVIKRKLFNINSGLKSENISFIVWELRIPRALLAIVVGGGLAVSGLSMQAITQNALADPYMLGVSSGALVGVTIINYLNIDIIYSSFGTPIAAFIGAIIALVFVYKLADIKSSNNKTKLILAGMAISIILNAASNFMIITMKDPNAIRNVLSWTMGSFARSRWNNIAAPTIGILASSIYFFLNIRHYDVITLGTDSALSLGVDVKKLKKNSIIIVALISAFSVSAAGIIGLIGFIIPHINRLIFGTRHKYLFPLSFLSGAVFLLWMDILSRTLIAPSELPIGIFTALIGGPLFVWMLVRKKD